MVNKAPKQCASLFKMIMTGEGGYFKAAPSPHRHTEGLLHNLRPGCFASVIKGIRLGRPDPLLTISYTAEHKDPGSESL